MDPQAWKNLYDSLRPITDLKPMDSEEYAVFSLKKGAPIKIGSTKESVTMIPRDDRYYYFFQRCPLWWMIPCHFWDGEPIGYVFRSVYGKEYVATSPVNTAQLMFGWEGFSDFKIGDPIILVEGGKDQIVLATVYPYVIALLGSVVSAGVFPLLLKLTNHVVLAYDSDETGNTNRSRRHRQFLALGASVRTLSPPEDAKDWGRLHYLVGSDYLKKYVGSSVTLLKGSSPPLLTGPQTNI